MTAENTILLAAGAIATTEAANTLPVEDTIKIINQIVIGAATLIKLFIEYRKAKKAKQTK